MVGKKFEFSKEKFGEKLVIALILILASPYILILGAIFVPIMLIHTVYMSIFGNWLEKNAPAPEPEDYYIREFKPYKRKSNHIL